MIDKAGDDAHKNIRQKDTNPGAKWLDGKQLSSNIRQGLKSSISEHALTHKAPRLAVILVGDDSASHIYVNKKQQACLEVGIRSELIQLSADISESTLLNMIKELNQRKEINGILVQLPLPQTISTQLVLDTICPEKDVDGFHAFNLGRLAQRAPLLRPCTPKGIMALLAETGEPIKGKHAVIVGASNIVGRPMSLELLLAGCTITVCHRFTKHLAEHVGQADILIAAAGKPRLIDGSWIKQGCIGIDVGIHRQDNGTLIGDIAVETAIERCSWLTPVPGGVGPMTVASLLENTWQAYQTQNNIVPKTAGDSAPNNKNY